MSNLTLNQTYVQNGLGTLTYAVTASQIYNVQIQSSVQSALQTGAGSGTARDKGLGVKGGFGGAGVNAQAGLGQGATGLGFGGNNTDNASGFASGYGAGAGGGGEGFTQGDQGLGHGGVGQGFGAGNGYQQPPAYVQSSQTTGPAIASGLSIVINQNGSPVYTAPSISPTQGAFKMRQPFNFSSGDTITVVLSSSTLSDEALNSIVSNISIGTGE